MREGRWWSGVRVLNFMLIGMYDENVREIHLTQKLIQPDFFVRNHLFRFSRTQRFSRESMQALLHDPPDDHNNTWFFPKHLEQN